MFEDSLFESGNAIKTGKTKWTSLSLAIQALAIGVMVLIPLMYTQALPKAALNTLLVAPPPPPPPPPPAQAPARVVRVQQIINNQLRAPSKIPKDIEMVKDDAPPPGSGVLGGMAGALNGVIGGILPMDTPKPIVREAAPVPQKVRVSQGVLQGNAINQPKPAYPAIAKAARVQGTVVLEAKISREGSIEDLRALSGSPLLIPAAIDAVKQWRYRPYLLNGDPVEVDTQITVNFALGG